MTSLSPAQVAGTACIRCGELLDNTAVPVGRFRGHRDSCTPKPAPWVHTCSRCAALITVQAQPDPVVGWCWRAGARHTAVNAHALVCPATVALKPTVAARPATSADPLDDVLERVLDHRASTALQLERAITVRAIAASRYPSSIDELLDLAQVAAADTTSLCAALDELDARKAVTA